MREIDWDREIAGIASNPSLSTNEEATAEPSESKTGASYAEKLMDKLRSLGLTPYPMREDAAWLDRRADEVELEWQARTLATAHGLEYFSTQPGSLISNESRLHPAAVSSIASQMTFSLQEMNAIFASVQSPDNTKPYMSSLSRGSELAKGVEEALNTLQDADSDAWRWLGRASRRELMSEMGL